jgi:hypothetical protein
VNYTFAARQHNFGSESWFVADNTTSAATANSLQPTHFQQKMLIRYRQLNFSSESQIRCRTHSFSNEHWFAVDNTISTVKTWFVADNRIQHRTPNSLRTTQFDSEHLIYCGQHNSTNRFPMDNTNLAANTWFAADITIQHRKPDSLQTFSGENLIHCGEHKLGSESQIHCRQHTFSSERWFAVNNTILAGNANSLQTTQFHKRKSDSLRTTQIR